MAELSSTPGRDLEWEVTVTATSVHGRRLEVVELDLPDGITGAVTGEGTELTLTSAVTARDHGEAVARARDVATDLLLVLSASFAPFELGPDREFRVTPIGPGHTSAVRVGGWATGYATTSPVDDARRFHGRDRWPRRLRNGMALFDAGQRADDELVRFVLTAAAMEVLSDADKTPLLAELSATDQQRLKTELRKLLQNVDLEPDQRDRLAQRLLSTNAQGSAQAIRQYLAKHGAVIEPGDLTWWTGRRGSYLHAGEISDDEPDRRYRLQHAISTCILSELDAFVPPSEGSGSAT